MAVAPSSGKVSVSKIKANLLRPALTSHFRCSFMPPESVRNFLDVRKKSGLGKQFPGSGNLTQELIELSCSDASLPGSSISTHEVNNDYTGVTERYAYRRLYDDKADFTFYVDRDYTIIYFFENWISYVVGEDDIGGQLRPNYSYRVNYPQKYIADSLFISKFERDFDTGNEEAKGILSNPSSKSGGNALTYQFVNAYPTSIASMPVSYESSQLLKCTVSFTYSRYVLNYMGIEETKKIEPAAPQTATGNPDIPTRPSPETIPNYSGIFGDDPTRVFQRQNTSNTTSTAFGNPRLS